VNRPYGFGGDLSQHPDKSQFKDIPPTFKHHLAQRQMGTPKETQPLTVFAIGKYWARPSGAGTAMFAPTPWGTPKTFPKKVFAELFP
jgi:hypothetical protein